MDTECIEWGRHRNAQGYGTAYDPDTKTTERVHRTAWRRARGPIPKGLHVLHKCDNPPCYNVDHLFLGTQKQNMDDKRNKGRDIHAAGETHGSSKLTAEQVTSIRERYRPGNGLTLGREFGVHKSTIARVAKGVTWKTI